MDSPSNLNYLVEAFLTSKSLIKPQMPKNNGLALATTKQQMLGPISFQRFQLSRKMITRLTGSKTIVMLGSRRTVESQEYDSVYIENVKIVDQISVSYSLLFSLQFCSYLISFLWLFQKLEQSFLKDWISFSNPSGSLTDSVFYLAGLLSKDSLVQCYSYLLNFILGQEPSLLLPLRLLLTFVCSSQEKLVGSAYFLSMKWYYVLQMGGVGLLFQLFLPYLLSLSLLLEALESNFLRQLYKVHTLTFYTSLMIQVSQRQRQRLFQCQCVPVCRWGMKFLLTNSKMNWLNSFNVIAMSCKQQKQICCILFVQLVISGINIRWDQLLQPLNQTNTFLSKRIPILGLQRTCKMNIMLNEICMAFMKAWKIIQI